MITEIDSDSIPMIVIVGSRWDRWRSLEKREFGFHMIVTFAEQFTSDPSDRERSPTIIWKPGLMIPVIECVLRSEGLQRLYGNQSSGIMSIVAIGCFQRS